ncbi:AMP-binding protein [Cecembia sp.]|uniref:AMP-binding protein n=1 Tax=Cecembia sp. TaxID=1898110 RepID=UPI0025BCC008|nr:AMP-binding protein [Cecembia sp.]
MATIRIENRVYQEEELQKGNCSEKDPYFQQALNFCQQWLSGEKSFKMPSSGSTGEPKDILVDRKQMEVSAASTRRFFQVPKGAKLLCCLNIGMVAGKMMLVRGMEWDSEIYLVKPSENPLRDMEVSGFDFIAMVPMQVAAALSEVKSLQILKNTQTLIIGGAPSSPSLIQKIAAHKIQAYQTYGMTETVSHIALAKINTLGLIYRTLPEVKIGTDSNQRLWIKAPMAGKKTLQTKDLVEIIDDQSFKWLGRADFTVNSGGIKLQPEIMEPKMTADFESVFGHVNFFLFGKVDEKLGQRLILLVEASQKETEKERELLEKLKSLFDRYHLPKEIHYVKEFTRTPSGKINRPETYKNCL